MAPLLQRVNLHLDTPFKRLFLIAKRTLIMSSFGDILALKTIL